MAMEERMPLLPPPPDPPPVPPRCPTLSGELTKAWHEMDTDIIKQYGLLAALTEKERMQRREREKLELSMIRESTYQEERPGCSDCINSRKYMSNDVIICTIFPLTIVKEYGYCRNWSRK